MDRGGLGRFALTQRDVSPLPPWGVLGRMDEILVSRGVPAPGLAKEANVVLRMSGVEHGPTR